MSREIKDGDVFFWEYKVTPKCADPYWCKSRIFIARGGWLFDTYWNGINEDGCHYTTAKDKYILDFKGNLDEFDKVPESEIQYYSPDDILNLNHRNSSNGNVYLRKGASRSREVMLGSVNSKISELESRIRVTKSRLENLQEEKRRIESGEDLHRIFI